MRLLQTDLYDIIYSTVHQSLSKCDVKWSTKHVCGVVLAAANYPKSGDKGSPITSNFSKDKNKKAKIILSNFVLGIKHHP